MIYQVQLNQKEEMFDVVEIGDELITIDPLQDYCLHRICIDNGQLIYNPILEIPPGLTTNQKAEITELIGQIMLTINEGVLCMGSGIKSYDLNLGDTDTMRVDVKFSMPHKPDRKTNALRWEFWLYSRGQRKDYTKTCDVLLCIGLNQDGSISSFLIPPSDENVMRLKKHVSVSVNWQRSKYSCYHYCDSSSLNN